MRKTIVSIAAASMLALASISLTGCSTNPEGTVVVFSVSNYEAIGGTDAIRNLGDFDLPAVNLEEGGLQTAFDQALANSLFLSERVGSIQRTDFKDGEFMTHVYDPSRTNAVSGFWYQKLDGTSSFKRIFDPLELTSESPDELPLLEQTKINEFVDREFSNPSANILEVNLAGTFLFRYTIENNVIVEVVLVGEDEASSPITAFDYGNTQLIQALSQKIIVETSQQ